MNGDYDYSENSQQNIYTINTMYYDNRLNTSDKRCPSTEMPIKNDIKNEEDLSSKSDSKRRRKIALLTDFGITFFVILVLLLIEFDVIPHRRIGFYCRDPKLSFPYKGETVSTAALLLTVYFIPLIIVGLVESRTTKRALRESFRRIWHWYKQYLLGVTILLTIIQCSKVIISEHRPHFFDTCQPSLPKNCTADMYVGHYQCQNSKDSKWFIADSQRSFPSGHTAVSIFAALFCIWYLEKCLKNMDCWLIKPLVQLLLLTAGTFCSLSRITDNRHHWWDVLAGVFFGFGFFIYVVFVWCDNFNKSYTLPPRPSHSTVTLLTDTTNKNAASVIL